MTFHLIIVFIFTIAVSLNPKFPEVTTLSFVERFPDMIWIYSSVSAPFTIGVLQQWCH